MEKNQEFTVSIEDISEDGAGIGKLDGYIWFIKDAVIGDVVRARAMKMKKNYGFARLMEILTSSEARVEPKCPVARQCGGCQLQAMSYEEQLKFKERKVKNHLLRIGKFKEDEIHMLPIMGMKEPWRYRNKAQFPFGLDKNGNIVAGFYAGRTHDIIECEDCLLGVEENKDILGIIKGFMRVHGIRPYDETTHKGLVRHALIRKGFHSGEIMVCLVINGKDIPAKEQLVEELCQVKGMTSISYSINQEKTNVIMGKEIVNLYGPGYITDNIGNVTYQISPLSFYQVNPVQTEKLYEILDLIAYYFPECEGINMDATVTSILHKSQEELEMLARKKVKHLYLGIESGLDDVLKFMKKDHDLAQAYQAIDRLHEAGLIYDAHIMTGVAGKGRGMENAEALAQFLNRTNPAHVVNFSMFLHKEVPLYQDIRQGTFVPADELETIREEYHLIERIAPEKAGANILYDGFHDFIHVRVRGHLPGDKEKMLAKLNGIIQEYEGKEPVYSFVQGECPDLEYCDDGKAVWDMDRKTS